MITSSMQQQPLSIAQRLKIPEVLRFEIEGQTKNLSFYKFAKFVLGYEKLGTEHNLWQKRLFEAVNQNGLHKLILLKPRGTYKTTFYTCLLYTSPSPRD